MTDYGLTLLGFVDKPLEVIREEIATAIKESEVFGTNADTTAGSPLGVLIGIFAGHVRQGWEVAQGVNAAFDPDRADGSSLAALAALTGTVKESATPSTVSAFLTGVSTRIVGAGSVASVEGADASRFVTLEAATLVQADAWAALTVYAVGDIVRNGGTQRIYICTDPGTSAASGGPTTQGTAIVDSGVIWRWLGDGDGYAEVEAEGETAGPVVANAFTLTQIETPVTGWSNVTNLLDATVGHAIELDAELRLRREEELRAEGASAPDAIRAELLRIDGVEQVKVFNNPTDVTDGDGLPPHSFEALVLGGADQDIWDAIWDEGPAGIQSYGTETGTTIDDLGDTQDVAFSRPDELTVWLEVDVTIDPEEYPADGDDQIKAALVALGADFQIADDLILSALYPAIFSVSGVLDVTEIRAGFTSNPSGTVNLAVGAREIARLDTSRIEVATTP